MKSAMKSLVISALLFSAVPASAKPSAHAKPLSLKQQIIQRDRVIAELRSQVQYLTGEVAHLRGAGGAGTAAASGSISDRVATYNRMMRRAKDDFDKLNAASKSGDQVMDDAKATIGQPGFSQSEFQGSMDLAKKMFASCKQYGDDALGQMKAASPIRQSILADLRFNALFAEGDLCFDAGDLGDEARAMGADNFRFFVPLHSH